MSRFHNRNFELLEPYDAKVSCTVLRGGSIRKDADLLDIFVNAIFPPVVPPKMCRIRIGVMSCHTQEDCDRMLDVFYETGKKYGII